MSNVDDGGCKLRIWFTSRRILLNICVKYKRTHFVHMGIVFRCTNLERKHILNKMHANNGRNKNSIFHNHRDWIGILTSGGVSSQNKYSCSIFEKLLSMAQYWNLIRNFEPKKFAIENLNWKNQTKNKCKFAPNNHLFEISSFYSQSQPNTHIIHSKYTAFRTISICIDLGDLYILPCHGSQEEQKKARNKS